MLKVNNIVTHYGDIRVLHNVSIEIGDNEIVSIIGSNGAGKSTLMNNIAGIVPTQSGTIEFDGCELTKLKGHQIVQKGVIMVPEGREVFPNMTVLENLEMGSYSIKRTKTEMKNKLEEMYTLFPRLSERKSQKAGSLSGGEQQMVAIARGLMADPKLLMCDEPSLGLAPVIVEDMFDIFVRINKEMGIPILLVEQNAFMALSISQRCYIMENGEIRISGDSAELAQSDVVINAYLGG
ncbi:MAG: ABC transporter ATP-binding protein [Candidatus Choladocola sp.]|nr:ABC transporter ATP-binding protein [Candidatus Choladocola sp.]